MENNKKNTRIHLSGLTCASCEVLITNELKGVEKIIEATVCQKKQIADVVYDKDLPVEEILNKIRKLGYSAELSPIPKSARPQKTTPAQWIYSLLILFGIYIIYIYLRWIGVMDWLNFDAGNVTYSVAFLIGIVASMSTCLAIVGAVVISFAAKYETQGDFYNRNLKPHLLFHAGRLGSFFLLGGLLGYIGGWLRLSTSFMSMFAILIAVVLAWLGLNILGFVPSISKIGIKMPKNTLKIWDKLKTSKHTLAPVILGAFTFFLPCGFTQSMQLFAISSGNFLVGGTTMLLFGLGTMPILLGLGMATTKFKNKKNIILTKTIGFLVIFFALYTLTTGLALLGVNTGFFDKKDEVKITTENNVQIIEMTVSYSGFTPNVFYLKAGVPVKWIINGAQISGCTNKIISPALGISKAISPGENIIEFTPLAKGTFGFSCWMGMVRGQFIIK